MEFSYIVHGVRKAFRDFTPIQTDNEAFYFTPTSADAKMIPTLPQELRRRLVAAGVYNEDGTVNLSTAERMGWAQRWHEEALLREQQAKQAVSLAPQAPGAAPQQ